MGLKLRVGVVLYTLLGLVLKCRIQNLTEIKAFEVVEILRFDVVGLVEIWCGIIYFVRVGPEM